jgi:2-keto-4-pentenoate hydratase/2-oxohepta-3-ene-1,7-dioic acid hydratase in catechol pathway
MDTLAETMARLLTARRSGTAQPAPVLPDAATAYAVQAAVAESLGWFTDGVPRHWKSGGAGRDAVLTHAPLPPAGVMPSPADLRAWPFHFRGIEAEIALRLAEPVDAARAAQDRPVAIDAMCAAIEVVDSRWAEGVNAPPLAKLADLQSHGALVLGDWLPYAARDWTAQRLRVEIGSTVRDFQGTHAFGDPAWGLPAWLRHATRDGALLPAGTVVTTGTWCGLPLAMPGDAVCVTFDGIGEVRIQF